MSEPANKSPLLPLRQAQDAARSPAPPPIRQFIAGGIFVASFLLYLGTLAPSVVTIFDDSLEFQLVAYRLGIAHPTGYPLYTLLGKLFTFLPFGDVAYRVNLLSAFFGAATVALLYLVIVQLSDGRMEKTQPSNLRAEGPLWATFPSSLPVHLGGIIGALLFAVSPVFWQQATIAEVYTLNAFFVVTLLLLTVSLPFSGEGQGGILRLAFVAGLALTHHRTIILLFPAIVLYLYLSQKQGWWQQPRLFKILLLAVLVGVAPLILYLYLPLRGHIGSLDGTYQNTWAGFWRQVSAGGYGTFLFSNPFNQERDIAFYGQIFQNQFFTLLPGVIGLFYLACQGRKFLVLTGVTFLTYTAFNLFYQVSDIEVFFIPPFLLWAAWSGLGVVFLGQIAGRLIVNDQQSIVNSQRFTVAAAVLILIIFAFIILQLVQSNLLVLAARNTWQVHDYGLDMLEQPPVPEKAAIVGIVGEMTLLRYFQETESRRPALETVAADAEADRLAAVENLLAEGKAVYLTRELPGAPERWSLSAVGPLIRVNPHSVTAPPPMEIALNQPVTPEISLLGYNMSHPVHTGPGLAPVRLTLFWQVTAPVATSLKVSARLLNPAGETATSVDAIPVHFAYPTTTWRPGEIVADVYDLVLPANTQAGAYTPLLIWYNPAQNATEVGRIELKPISIE